MIRRPRVWRYCAVTAILLLGLQAPGAQPDAPGPARPPAGPITEDLQKLIARLQQCWDVPAAVIKSPSLVVKLRINLNPDGSVAGPPVVVNASQDPLFPTATRSAIRAVAKCAPFSFLPAARYEAWHVVEVVFDPHMISGDKTK